MNFEVIFLGTSAAVPSYSRGHSAIALKYFDEILLFDCGEGTQRQLIRSKTSYMRINKIFISHFHGDHFLGLPGLLQTMSLADRSEPLTIYGPRGIERMFDLILEICRSEIAYPIKTVTIKEGPIVETDIFRVKALKMDHSALTYGFLFEEVKDREFILEKALALGLKPGPIFSRLKAGETVEEQGKTITPDDVLGAQKPIKRLLYTSDTRPTQKTLDNCRNAILIHDSTYDDSMKEQAFEATHSTSVDAAQVALKGKAKELILTHISPRYTDTRHLLKEAQDVFEKTTIARDLMKLHP